MQEKVNGIDLVSSRKEQLIRRQQGQLRPFGKWMDVNVFEWKYPVVEDVLAFLEGVPFKTIVIIPVDVLDAYPELEEVILNKHVLLVYGGGKTACNIVGRKWCVNSFIELFEVLKMWIKENEAVLFIADGKDADDEHALFINELKNRS